MRGAATGDAGLNETVELVGVASLPLQTRFRGILRRDLAVLRGPAGWAEFSPFPEYDDAQAQPWWDAAVEAATVGWPDPVRTSVPVNATVPAVPAEQVRRVLAGFPGCTTAKVKVSEPGQPVSMDLDRLAAVRDALGAAGLVRIDVNGAWSESDAVDLIPRYARAAGGLEYVEQPCRTVAELAAVRRRTDVRIAADESVRRADDPLAVVAARAADVVVLKAAPLGGVRACLRLAAQLAESDVSVVVSSALESSIGLAAGVALAASLPTVPHACGLGTASLLADDLTATPLLPHHGVVPVSRPMVDPAALLRLAADQPTDSWWRERVARVSGGAMETRTI